MTKTLSKNIMSPSDFDNMIESLVKDYESDYSECGISIPEFLESIGFDENTLEKIDSLDVIRSLYECDIIDRISHIENGHIVYGTRFAILMDICEMITHFKTKPIEGKFKPLDIIVHKVSNTVYIVESYNSSCGIYHIKSPKDNKVFEMERVVLEKMYNKIGISTNYDPL